MKPWIDREKLIQNAKLFVQSYGYFFRNHAGRISSLVEISVYNSLVSFYRHRGFTVSGENLGPKKSFRYKLTATGLAENYSHFLAQKEDLKVHILHNIRIQSAHDKHLYFTADVVVADENGATTQLLKSGRRHSFVDNDHLQTFVEVKHLNPFPEVLFNFMGLILEFIPGLVEKKYTISKKGHRLTPVIAFTGVASEHAEKIRESLTNRYGVNIVFGTSSSYGRLSGFDNLNRYKPVARPETDALDDS